MKFDPLVRIEIRKTRPAVIISKDSADRNLARVVVVPLTSNTGQKRPVVRSKTLAVSCGN
jgi:mRNA interferase MazF